MLLRITHIAADKRVGSVCVSFKDPKDKPGSYSKRDANKTSKKRPAEDDRDHGERTEAREPIVFTIDPNDVSREFRIESSENQLSHQIDELKEQLRDLPRDAEGDGLTSDQTDLLKKYIALKEAEVRDLRDQRGQYQSYLKRLTHDLETQTRRARDTTGELESLRRSDESLKSQLRHIKADHEEEISLLKNDFEEKLRQSGNYQSDYDELSKKREEYKERVREDLKRIKLKERELENKYELLKRDMQALLDSKDKHVLELKKKSDALELELESLEERLRKNNASLGAVDAKKRRLVETMRLAITLLETIDRNENEDDDSERKAG